MDVDFGTKIDPWLSVHSSTQTVPPSTSNSEIQTTPTQLPMVDEMTQEDPVDLYRIIEHELFVKNVRAGVNLGQGKEAAAKKVEEEEVYPLLEFK